MIIDNVEYDDTILTRLEKAQIALDRLVYKKIEGNIKDNEWDATQLFIEYHMKDNTYKVTVIFNKDVSEESRKVIVRICKELGINIDNTNGYAQTTITEKALDSFVGLTRLNEE